MRRFAIPIYDDVIQGQGGIAGGRFTSVDTLPNSYVATSGTAQSATATTLTLASGASSTNDFYKGMHVTITGGTGIGQDHQRVIAYNGSTKVATLSGSWITTPDSTSSYQVNSR